MRSQKKRVPEATQRGIVNRLSKGILIRPKQTTLKLALAGKQRNTKPNFWRKGSRRLSKGASKKSRQTIIAVRVNRASQSRE